VADDEVYQQVVAEVRARLGDAGTNLNALMSYMKDQGLSIMQAIRVVHEVLGRLDIAKTFTATSTVYRAIHDAHEPFHRELVEAFSRAQHEEPTPRPTRPERELADLRASLAWALRLVQQAPGPEGLTLLTVPSDREIIDEARRLRVLADS
jgi:hypothetical protein